MVVEGGRECYLLRMCRCCRAGKKPFKKKFQKYKNTEDKAQIVKAGSADDLIEERGLDDRFKCAGLCFAAPRHGWLGWRGQGA